MITTAIALLTMSMPAEPAATIYSFKVRTIDGEQLELSKYRRQVLLVVNVASKCGLTPQYTALQATYDKYKTKGFAVLGFPANNFGGQEPGTESEIKTFCTGNYKVTFPMFAKVSVKGDDTTPLYKWLISESERPKDDIEWNFAKFLIGRDGKVIKRFSPQTKPDDAAVVAAIEAALKQAR